MTRKPSDGALGRRQTILRIIKKEQNKSGRTPSADEIAAVLACSVARVRFHLSALEQQGATQCTNQPRLL